MPFDEKRPLSASTLKLRAGRLARSKPLWALVLVSYLFVLYLRRLDSYVAPQTDGAARKLPAPYTSGPAVGPPTWDRLRKWERELPQHNQSLPFPEGRHGRYVRFTNQIRGLGWNNVLNEMLLNAEVAHQSNRGFVCEEYTWMQKYYPWQPAGWPEMTPMNALVSGPMAGGNWEAGDMAPRSIATWYWEEVCPPAERTVITSNDAKNPMRGQQGIDVFKHYVKLLKDTPGRCVEFTASSDDNFPQLFDLWLVGDPKGVSMSEHFLDSATSRLLGPSPVVSAAIDKNALLFLPRGPRPVRASNNPFQRMMAVHIRRGDFGPACIERALWASTYYQWNMWPAHPDKFVVPKGSGDGHATDDAKELYRSHCFPTDAETLATIRRARAEYTTQNPARGLDVLYVLTNADADWVREFAVMMRKEGWGTVVGTPDLLLDSEGTEVAMAVDMEIATRAEVFIGNGWSSFTSNINHRRIVDRRPPLANRFW